MSNEEVQQQPFKQKLLLLFQKRGYNEEDALKLLEQVKNDPDPRNSVLQWLFDQRNPPSSITTPTSIEKKATREDLDQCIASIFKKVDEHQKLNSAVHCKHCKVGVVFQHGQDRKLGLDEGQVFINLCSHCGMRN